MKFNNLTAEIFVPDLSPVGEALSRTTDLCLAAHQDDIEIMAAKPILDGFHQPNAWFTGVVITDGRGSPRDGDYARTTDDEMRVIRKEEQRKAAIIGNYSAMVFLDYPSSQIKNATDPRIVEDLVKLLRQTTPKRVYTHNLADKHDTHIAVVLRVIEALRKLETHERPDSVIACEVWRALDWVNDEEKIVMDLSAHVNQQQALLGVFDSQIAGGKSYDLAALNRRQANATFFESHGVDAFTAASFGIDLTPLMTDHSLAPLDYISGFLDRFKDDVANRIQRMS